MTEQGFRVSEVSQLLDVNAHSLCEWRKKHASNVSRLGSGRRDPAVKAGPGAGH
ncbi:transposase [Devosia sp. MC521]|nr:transposase [Devosia sp. MC521]QMW64453.1 transposase [Devosia sp. MC521]